MTKKEEKQDGDWTDPDDEDVKVTEKQTSAGENCLEKAVAGESKINIVVARGSNLVKLNRLVYTHILRGSVEDTDRDHESSEDSPAIWNPVNLINYLNGNSKEISPSIAREMLASDGGAGVLLPGEEVIKAFTTWQDLTLFTSSRILVTEVHGEDWWALKWGEAYRRLRMRSIPYSSVRGFGIKGASTFSSGSIMIYTAMRWMPQVRLGLVSGTAHLPELQNFLAEKVIGSQSAPIKEVTGRRLQAQEWADWILGAHGKVSNDEAMTHLASEPPVLLSNEQIKLAYRIADDFVIFTTHRLLVVDTNDWDPITKQLLFRTMPYQSALSFSITTQFMSFDRTEEVAMHTAMPKFNRFNPLRPGSVTFALAAGNNDVFEAQSLLAEQFLR